MSDAGRLACSKRLWRTRGAKVGADVEVRLARPRGGRLDGQGVGKAALRMPFRAKTRKHPA